MEGRSAFVFHGFQPRKELCGGLDMEADFLVVLPGPPVTLLTIECKTTLSKEALGQAKKQWNSTKRVGSRYVLFTYTSYDCTLKSYVDP